MSLVLRNRVIYYGLVAFSVIIIVFFCFKGNRFLIEVNKAVTSQYLADKMQVAWVSDEGERGTVRVQEAADIPDIYYIYLPANADISNSYLSINERNWYVGSKLIETKMRIPALNQALILEHKVLGKTLKTIEIRTLLGSKDVVPVFINTIQGGKYRVEGKETFSYNIVSDEKKNTDKKKRCIGNLKVGSHEFLVALKGRGNSSWNEKQKSYNVTIYKNDSNYNIRTREKTSLLLSDVESSEYSLISHSADGSLMRNRVGYKMAQKLGFGIKCNYVDLWIDGTYQGLYLLTERNTANTPTSGYMVEFDDRPDSSVHQLQIKSLYGVDENGGYFSVKKNNNTKDGNFDFIDGYLSEAWEALLDTNSDRYKEFVDFNAWAHFYLLEEILKNYDCYGNSYFIVDFSEGDKNKATILPAHIWDLDHACGCSYEDIHYITSGWYITNIEKKNFFLEALGRHKDFLDEVEKIRAADTKMYQDMNVEQFMMQEVKRIMNSANMHETRWPHGTLTYWSTYFGQDVEASDGTSYIRTSCWNDYVTNLCTYFRSRIEWISNNKINTK